jgi:hypothetical protein
LCTPEEYAWANLLSELSAVIALLNWDMGCKVVGKLFSSVTTCDGRAARFAHSFETACVYNQYSTQLLSAKVSLCVLWYARNAEKTSHTSKDHWLLKVYRTVPELATRTEHGKQYCFLPLYATAWLLLTLCIASQYFLFPNCWFQETTHLH